MPSYNFFSNTVRSFHWRAQFLFFVFFIFVSSAVFSQEQEKPREFQFDILSFQTRQFSPDSARVDIYVAVPYSWLMFLNATEKYVADYEASVRIYEKATDSL